MFATVAFAETANERAFPPFDGATYASQLFWLAITFSLFYLFVSRVALPRIGGILEGRHDRIAQDLNEASRLRDEADKVTVTYERELEEARGRARAIAQAAHDSAKADAGAERERAETQMAEKLATAEAEILAMKNRALTEVDVIAAETAGAIVRQLIGAETSEAELAAAVKAAAQGRD